MSDNILLKAAQTAEEYAHRPMNWLLFAGKYRQW